MDKEHEQAMHHVAMAHALGTSAAEQRRAARVDVIGHSGVQPWSAGDLFPCVIATVERYADWAEYVERERAARRPYLTHAAFYALDPVHRLRSVSYELIAYGRREEYATREDAEMVARHLNVSPAMRAAWQRGGVDSLNAAHRWDVRPHDQAGVS